MRLVGTQGVPVGPDDRSQIGCGQALEGRHAGMLTWPTGPGALGSLPATTDSDRGTVRYGSGL